MMNMKTYFYIGGLTLGRRIKRELGSYFHMTNSYFRFTDVFNKRSSLFLLTLVAIIISSKLISLKNCKFLQRIFKARKLRVKMFKFLNI
jgi:hypothetical protein